MTTAAFTGLGTVFAKGASTISEVNSITGPNISRDQIDVTSLDSTGGYREFITGFRDAGELTLNCNFTVAGYDDFMDSFSSSASDTWTITFDNTEASVFSFDGFVQSVSMGIPLDDKVTMDVTIKLSSVVTFTS